MERVDTIMERLGFKKDGATDDVAAAFVKNLIKQAYGVEVEIPPQYRPEAKPRTQQPAQLSFDLGDSSKKVG